MALHSLQAALISVTYGRFLPLGCHANAEVWYEFLNMFDWKGNSRVCEGMCVWEFDHLCVFMWSVSAHAYLCTKHHCLLHYYTSRVAVTYSCGKKRGWSERVLVSRSTQFVRVHTVHVPLCAWSPVRVCSHTCVEEPLCPQGTSASSRESVQSETEKSRVSRRGCPDMKACRNGDNRLWIDEWRPVN